MSGGPQVEQTGSAWMQLLALMVVVLCAMVGGIIVQIMMRGISFQSGTVGPVRIKACLTAIQVPPLVGMILSGCLARNFLCEAYMQHYPEVPASWIRVICLSIILMLGGMELDFAGKGLTVVLLTICPQFCEASAAAVASRYIFDMPWALCFAQGFTLGAVSPAVVVPSLMILHKADYGTKKGIPTTLIAAASFDDIIAITIFSVFLSIGLNGAPKDPDFLAASTDVVDATESARRLLDDDPMIPVVHEEEEEHKPIWWEICFNLIQFAVGLVIAFGVGFLMKCFNKFDPVKTKWPKFFFCLLMAIGVPITCDVVGWPETKYVAIIFFGYMCFQQWRENKPEHELHVFWMLCQPFLFGTVGAAIQFSIIEPSMVGRGFGTILIGVTARWIGTFCAAFEKKYTYRERAFMAFAWIPKATVQAALGGICLMRAKQLGLAPEYVQWGQAMLTTAVFAICLTAPLGAIFINTLGTKWLEYDGDVHMGSDDEQADTKNENAPTEPAQGLEPEVITDREKSDHASATVVPMNEASATIDPKEDQKGGNNEIN